MLIGAVQVLAGFGVLAKNQLARWVGVAAAAVNPVAQRPYLSWSLAMFTLDILVMHGLLVDGRRTVRPF